MRKILLASHGYLAKGMKQTLELILGKQSSVEILCGYTPECENVRDAIREIVENGGEEELIILTDVFGGSINNECMRYLGRQKYHLIAGMNLPLLIDLLELEEEYSTERFLQNLAEQGSPYLKYCNVMQEQEKTADEDF